MTDYPCRQGDPDDWFAKPGTDVARKAKQACFQSCPKANECATYAIERGIPFGIWGGVDEKERERLWQGNRPRQFQEELEASLAGVWTRKEPAA